MPSSLRSLAVSSLALLLVCTALGETRPHYGGVVRVEVRAAQATLDPIEAGASPVTPLVFDTLVKPDGAGGARPGLATDWQQENERRWRVSIRKGVRFSDGTLLTPTVVASSLRRGNANWTIREAGDAVTIETDDPQPDLPAMLALPRNAVVLRGPSAELLGTGAFVVSDFQPRRTVSLTAREDGWQPRPFVDTIEIQFGRGLREQNIDLELGRADVVEAGPDQLARAAQPDYPSRPTPGLPGTPAGRRMFASDPIELFALRFNRSGPAKDIRVREAISVALDRQSIANVLLQRHGEAAGGLLPDWMTGYSFLFPTAVRTARARQLRAEAGSVAPITIAFDAADPLARVMVERIALNAADAGIMIRPLPSTQNTTVPDGELVRLRLLSANPATAIEELARPDALAIAVPAVAADSPAELYRATTAGLKDFWALPIAYAPAAYAISSRVRNWTMTRAGDWNLEELWLAAQLGAENPHPVPPPRSASGQAPAGETRVGQPKEVKP